MLVWLTDFLGQYYSGFKVFQYLTLRAILGTLTALFIALFLGPRMIQMLRDYQIGQSVRNDGPQSHLTKSGTPTMGGTLILIALTVATLLWSNLNNHYVWILVLTTLAFGWIGFMDDYRKLILRNSKGLLPKEKYSLQSVVALIAVVGLFVGAQSPAETHLIVPFFKQVSLDLGLFYIVLSYFVIVGSSNAVNLTDGLDGLAILPTVMVGSALGVFAYASGHVEFSAYLGIPYLPHSSDLVVFCGALAGAGLGFLWFNAYPAQVFMGDVGSLALGAALGLLAVMVRQELVLLIMGGVFVMETVSVILQVASFKLTGKRIFRMAPLHHHFELKGWHESKVIVRFWIITLVLVLVGLATLKLR